MISSVGISSYHRDDGDDGDDVDDGDDGDDGDDDNERNVQCWSIMNG